MTTTVRRIEAWDEPRWRELWDGYTRFYEREPEERLTKLTWARIFDPSFPIHAIVADRDGEVIGMANYVIHPSTSQAAPVCYLQDLFVDPALRGTGAGRALIDWLVAEMRAQGWSRLYWNTRRENARARALYDRYAPESGFVRYVVANE
jgi:GNAT superfamily N-acetyltransferase